MTQHDHQKTEEAHLTAEVLSTNKVQINGESFDVPEGEDPYTQVYAKAQHEARQLNRPVIVEGIDNVRGETSLFTITAEGTAEPLDTKSTASTTQVGSQKTNPADQSQTPTVDSAKDTETAERSVPTAVQPSPELSRAERRHLIEAERPAFVAAPKAKPTSGARRALYNLSAGTINLGPSQKEKVHQEWAERIARPLDGSRNTAVLSLKGGIGKTSTTVGVGMTLAKYRDDIPCAIDANPDSGDLAERALGEAQFHRSTRRTISDLLADLPEVDSLTTLQTYLHQVERLHVLAGEQDPEVSDSLTAEEWLRIHRQFAQYYPVILTDCGTGVTHNAMKGILQTADNLVIAAGFAVSGAERARQTLAWLSSHGYEKLARESIVVITDKEQVSEQVEKSVIRQSLRGLCRQLVVVPFDRSAVDGDRMDLENLHPKTRKAYMKIAASIIDGYS